VAQDNTEVVRSAISAYNRRDFEALRTIHHPEVELDWSASRGLQAGVYRGWGEVMRFFQDFQAMFDRVHVEPHRFIEHGDSVVVPNAAQMRGRDGIETVARSAFVFEIRDGLVVRVCLYQETHEALEAVGLRERG
jgi:ketosteroid isomerase-like protein